MSLYEDDPNDPNYVIFNDKGKLIGLRNACEEIKQKTENGIDSGGICYILSEIITLGPLIENYFAITELPKKNGIRQFRIENKAKEGESKIVGLRINKRIGFPKSQKGIDIQVLMEYLKEEIKDVNQGFIEKLENSKNSEFNFNDGNINPSLLKKILIEIAEHYPDKYNKFLENKDGNNDLKDKEGLMKEILSNNNKDRDFIIDNIFQI